MEHVVFYPSAEGVQAFKRVESLEAAVSFVEHLRNSENITDFSVHSLERIPLAFRAYYHVEVPGDTVDAQNRRRTDEAFELADDDRSADWVAEAEVVEPPAAEVAPIPEPAAASVADAPVEPQEHEAVPEPVSGDVIPSGRRSMGFFTR